MKRIIVPYNVASKFLEIGDVLSYRLPPWSWNPLTWLGWFACKLIAIAGRNPDVHTALMDREPGGDLMALGMRFNAQKLKLLADEVADNPGLIDVYRYVGREDWQGEPPWAAPTIPWVDRRQICIDMRHFALKDRYGVGYVLRAGLQLAFFARLLAPVEVADDAPRKRGEYIAPFCTHGVVLCFLWRGYQFLQKRQPSRTLPGDLVESLMLAYVCTLGPEVADPESIEAYFDPSRQAPPIPSPSWSFPLRGFWVGLGRPVCVAISRVMKGAPV